MANYLAHNAKVRKIYYPGLPDDPRHELAKRRMNGFGALISFDLGSYATPKKFLDRVRLCSLGESLGGVETLNSHPESMTHASVPAEARKRRASPPAWSASASASRTSKTLSAISRTRSMGFERCA
jgi:cystathionine beta-lyase/cystathionine gamma-synthase